jgi:hypothetical protein
MLAQTLNSSFREIYNVLSLTKSRFGNYLYLTYQLKLVVKNTTNIQMSASYPNFHIEIAKQTKKKQKTRRTLHYFPPHTIFEHFIQ